MNREHVLRNEMVEGFRVRIIQDTDAEPPTCDEDNGYVYIVTTDNREFVRHPQILSFGKVTAELFRETDDEEMTQMQWEIKEKFEVYPLYAYIHSGIALSLERVGQFSCPWDSGQIGFVLVSKEPGIFKDDTEGTRLEVAQGMVESWNQYFQGDVWGYVIERPLNDEADPDDDDDWELVDSCWGFYGDEYCWEEAQQIAKAQAETDRQEEEKIGRMMVL